MGIPVKLEAFEGPLDLLLHLIDKNKVDIYDIPIVLITEQYLDYVNHMDREDLDVVSEFLVMAATLIDIKSRMLLPKEEDEEGEEEGDPRAELVARLIEYKTYKYMSLELRDMQGIAERAFFKEEDIPKEVAKYVPPVDLDKLVGDLTLNKMGQIFQDILKRQENKIDPVRSKFGTIELEEVNLNDKISYVRSYAGKKKKFSFKKLLQRQGSKMEVIVTFLAILELMKNGKIHAEQERTFDDIIITSEGVQSADDAPSADVNTDETEAEVS
ncbi:MAG: segregation/condensation protein A [Lachnospiraceae bacterium]|nr:segregation/condensation protein A [Lachnospiraceae bacterium]